jgi:hypothetical protein
MRYSVSFDEYDGAAATYTTGSAPPCAAGSEADDMWTLSSSFARLSFAGALATWDSGYTRE